ncbi:hypothetical protein [Hyphococcus sp.]|jgi:hypothetical protein|uniref:hypothetical protein n=1 Tax=Hyphococcus sp. TaxID=2038636 RepID=UPI003D151F0B
MNAALSAILAALFVAAAAAQPSETEAVDDAIACLSVEGDGERLACLEKAAKTLQVTRIVREEEAAAAEENEKANFGLAGDSGPEQVAEAPEEFGEENVDEIRRDKDGKRIKSIKAKIVEVRLNPRNVATISLENGQVWRQLNSDDKILRFGNKERLLTAKVKRSILGNYMLTVEELHQTIRVRRVK